MHINTKSLVATYVVIELFFYVLFQGCGSNYFCCHGMSVENCNSTTCLISSDVHLYNVGRLYGWLLNITPYSSQAGCNWTL